MVMSEREHFKQKQLEFSRVKDAYSEKENTVKNYFLHKNLNYQGYDLLIRVFKKERILEVWCKSRGQASYVQLLQVLLTAYSGTTGPKRREGDQQIPEGIYHITNFNPQSKFHLSLRINYPNSADMYFADQHHPGSDIYIHGGAISNGCIAIGDDRIKELYLMALEATGSGQYQIPVHIFPCRLSEDALKELIQSDIPNDVSGLWRDLQTVYEDFETTHRLGEIRVGEDGRYFLAHKK
jgi:murein L,D-transpeptidase YafK